MNCAICNMDIREEGDIAHVVIQTEEVVQVGKKGERVHLCKLCYLPIWTYIYGKMNNELCAKLGWSTNWKQELEEGE